MGDTEVVQTIFGPMEAFAGECVTRDLRRFGAYQRSDLAMLLSLVRPGDYVLDVGAHIGTFAVPLATAVGPQGHLVAFEPVPETAAVLARNLPPNASIERVVIGAQSGTAAAPLLAKKLGQTSFEVAADNGRFPVETLDHWWVTHHKPLVAVIKMDVQGMELAALGGAAHVLEDCRPVVQFEVDLTQRNLDRGTLRALGQFFEVRGYRCYINQLPREAASDRFRLGHLRSVASLALSYWGIFDVVAVPRGSSRLVVPSTPRWVTTSYLLARGARAHGDRLHQRLFGRSFDPNG